MASGNVRRPRSGRERRRSSKRGSSRRRAPDGPGSEAARCSSEERSCPLSPPLNPYHQGRGTIFSYVRAYGNILLSLFGWMICSATSSTPYENIASWMATGRSGCVSALMCPGRIASSLRPSPTNIISRITKRHSRLTWGFHCPFDRMRIELGHHRNFLLDTY